MKNLKNSHSIAGQSNSNVPKSRKHDANLQKNTTLYFQIGLILCLLGTYGLFEMRFETKSYDGPIVYVDPDDNFYHMQNIVVEPDAPKKVEVKAKKQVRIVKPPIIVDNSTATTDNIDLTTDPPTTSDPVIDPNPNPKPEPAPKAKETFTLLGVEVVPVYPGCEDMTTNEDRIKCMNKKISKLVQRKFDTDIASDYGLSGKQRINVQFKINQDGLVTDIMARAPHPSLEKEAQRVTNKLPKMKPGLQSEKPVSVVYNLPIVFQVN